MQEKEGGERDATNKVLELKWIDGKADGVTLHAPKGMAVVQDFLYLADIDTVRAFDRKNGKPVKNIPVNGAVFLNDLAAAADGSVFVTDSGGGAVYRIDPEGRVAQRASKSRLLDRITGPGLTRENGCRPDFR